MPDMIPVTYFIVNTIRLSIRVFSSQYGTLVSLPASLSLSISLFLYLSLCVFLCLFMRIACGPVSCWSCFLVNYATEINAFVRTTPEIDRTEEQISNAYTIIFVNVVSAAAQLE